MSALLEQPNERTISSYTAKDLQGVRAIYAQHYSEAEIAHVFTRINDPAVSTLVAREGDEVIGVCVLRAPHEKLLPFSATTKPLELYSLYGKQRRSGAGNMLVQEMTKQASAQGYTEIVVASADRWQQSWGFYDAVGFTRVGQINEPNGELLQIWTSPLE